MPRDFSLNFSKNHKSYNLLHAHIHHFLFHSNILYVCHRENRLQYKYSCSCPDKLTLTSPPTYLTNICTLNQKSLRKNQIWDLGLAPAGNCWKTGLRSKDVIQLGFGNTGLRIWHERNCFGNYSLFKTDLHPDGSDPLRVRCVLLCRKGRFHCILTM